MNILLDDFNANVGRKGSFKLTIGSEGSQEIRNDKELE
jgi:hypothetical protein